MIKNLKAKFVAIQKELEQYFENPTPIQMAKVTTKDGLVIEAEAIEAGQIAMVEGVPVAAGEYMLEDGTTLVIGEGGAIGEVKPMVVEEAKEDFTAKFAEYDAKFADYEARLTKASKVIDALMSITKEIVETPIAENVEAAPAASFKAVEKETTQEKFERLAKILTSKNQ